LFPQPWSPKTDASEGTRFFKVLEYFRLIGQVMAKVLQDGRLLDLPLSTAFYKLILGQVCTENLYSQIPCFSFHFDLHWLICFVLFHALMNFHCTGA
jgi:hypothetical protein